MNFLFNNYKQALDIIAADRASLAALCTKTPMITEDFERYFQSEKAYLQVLTKPCPDEENTVMYMNTLMKLRVTRYEYPLLRYIF